MRCEPPPPPPPAEACVALAKYEPTQSQSQGEARRCGRPPEPRLFELTLPVFGLDGDLAVASLTALFAPDWLVQAVEKEVVFFGFGYVANYHIRMLRKSEIPPMPSE